MQNNFLCPNHRQWLISNPLAAQTHLIYAQDTGLFYCEQGAWRQALPYLGCAYETAEIVLTQRSMGITEAVIDFTSSAIVLADSLQKIAQKKMSFAVYQQTQQRLKVELSLTSEQPQARACIIDCLKSLTRGADLQHQYSVTVNTDTNDCAIH